MSMYVGFELGDFGASEERQLLEYLREEIRKEIGRVLQRIEERIQRLVSIAVQESPEWDSLLGGTLQKQFGVADPVPVLEGIVQALQQSVEAIFVESDANSLGDVLVSCSRDDFRDVLAVPGAVYESKAGPIPWLEWLLFAGDDVILTDPNYEFRLYKRNYAASRTGNALMIHRNPLRKRRRGEPPARPVEPWRIEPSSFAGTHDDNWLTRTLRPLLPDIEAIIADEMRKL